MEPKTRGLDRRVPVLMSPWMHDKATKAAEVEGVSLAEYIRHAVQVRLTQGALDATEVAP